MGLAIINITTIQCQIESEPIFLPAKGGNYRARGELRMLLVQSGTKMSCDGLPKYLRFAASDAHNEADWSGWNTWADQKIADALAAERKIVLEAIAEEMNNLVNEVHDHLADEVKGLRVEVTALEEVVEQLRSVIKSERAKVIDLPSPLRRAIEFQIERTPRSRLEKKFRCRV